MEGVEEGSIRSLNWSCLGNILLMKVVLFEEE